MSIRHPVTIERAGILNSFQIAAEFLSRIFLEPPDSGFLKCLKNLNLVGEWPFARGNTNSRLGVRLIKEYLFKENAEMSHKIKADFTRLFIGLGHPLAPPYESVYRSEERILFDRITLDVRAFYQRFGLKVERLHKEPDDHIGYELAFIAYLCGECFRAWSEKKQSRYLRLDSALKRFLAGHVMAWSSEFSSLIIRHAESEFYRGAASLLEGFLQGLSDYLNLSPE